MRKWVTSLLIGLASFMLTISIGYSNPGIEVTNIVEPATPLTSHWCFVVDNSHSMRGVFPRARAAFIEALRAPSDELEFAIVAFNNQGMDRFRDWEWLDGDNFAAASAWIEENPHRGVLSYGLTAIGTAIRQERDELTVILITDGGFTEVSKAGGSWAVITNEVVAAQQWRANRGFKPAQIASMGIHNPNYRGGNKPQDAECQAFLRGLGETYGGGYWLVSGALQ